MRIGSETGSVINALSAGWKDGPTPVVGMGATELHWTDRTAGTITRVSPSGKTFWWRADVATRVDSNGMSEMQEYTYAPSTDGPETMVRLGKRGWRSGGRCFAINCRRTYHDYSF